MSSLLFILIVGTFFNLIEAQGVNKTQPEELVLYTAEGTKNGIPFGHNGSGHDEQWDDKVIPCGVSKEILINEKLVIQSPSKNSKKFCKWRFLFSGCRLSIRCPRFHLNNFFCLDSFEIQDAKGRTQRFCGENGPNLTFDTSINEIEVRFNSNFRQVDSEGFQCRLACQDGDSQTGSGLFGVIGNILANGGGLPGAGLFRPTQAPSISAVSVVDKFTKCSCGEGSPGFKIVNGQMVAAGEFPWQAGIVRAGTTLPFCGGSLINSRYVVTAAHCVLGRPPESLEIILNEAASQPGVTAAPIVRKIEHIIRHKDFGPRLDYDMALIRLQRHVDISGDIVPVCLPTNPSQDYFQKTATVSGWGAVAESGALSQTLLQTNVGVISNAQCSLAYPSSVTARMLCAYRENADACKGDSGGPLVLAEPVEFLTPENNTTQILGNRNTVYAKYTQIGIVSWGQGCARKGRPGVYTRVTEFLSWIRVNANDGVYCSNDEDG